MPALYDTRCQPSYGTHEVGVDDRSCTISFVFGDLLLPFRGIIPSAQQSTLET